MAFNTRKKKILKISIFEGTYSREWGIVFEQTYGASHRTVARVNGTSGCMCCSGGKC